MDREKRDGKAPLPDNLNEVLNDAQRQALTGLKYTGWKLLFLRRPLFQEPVLVVRNTHDGKMGILDKDGKIKMLRNFKIREEDIQAQMTISNNSLVWTK
jgi:hypothetical protein